MKKTLLLSSLLLCSGIAMAQGQQVTSIEETMRQHLTAELKRHGITEAKPMRPTDHKPVMGIKAPAPQAKAATEQLCDSTVNFNREGNPFSKTIYTYDAEGYCILRHTYSWYSEQWNPSTRTDITHDENGNPTIENVSNWDGNDWSISFRYEYTYDDQGRQICYTSYYRPFDEWVGSYKVEYTYDANDYQTSYTSYMWNYNTQDWEGSYKYESAYDDQGRQIMSAYYNGWKDGNWVGGDKYEYSYNEFGQQTSFIIYAWADGDWAGRSKNENFFDDKGNETGYCISYWTNGEWDVVDQGKIENTYDDQGNLISLVAYFYSFGEWLVNYKTDFTYDEKGNKLTSVTYHTIDGEWISSAMEEYAYDDNGYLATVTGSYFDTWLNDWQYGFRYAYVNDAKGHHLSGNYYTWTGEDWGNTEWVEYAYDEQGSQTGYARYVWLGDAWKGETKHEAEHNEFGSQIRYSTYTWRDGAWAESYRDETYYTADGTYAGSASYREQSTILGPMYLKVNMAGREIADHIDEENLIFTGKDFKVSALYVDEFIGDPEADAQPGNAVIWQNDGSMGSINWSGVYRFSNVEHATGEECHAFTMEEWNTLKTSTFYVDLVGDSPQIRVTSGWWTTQWTGSDIYPGNELLTRHEDGSWTLTVNLEGDPLLDVMDEQHLLFTGEDYTVLRIRVAEGRNEEDWVRRCIWQNDGSYDYTNFENTYCFGREGHEDECIATFNQTDWDLIKQGHLIAEIEAVEPHQAWIYVTTDRWSAFLTDDAITYGSPLLTGETTMLLTGEYKREYTFDDQGRTTCFSTYEWSWLLNDWELSTNEVYYYSEHEVVDIEQIVSEIRPRLSKELRDGQVRIVVGDKVYNLEGQQISVAK